MKTMRASKSLKCSLMLLIAAVCVAAAPAGAQASSCCKPADLTTIKGIGYDYSPEMTALVGATVSVVEYPNLKARVDKNGSFALKVPKNRSTTIVIDAPGHSRMYSDTRVRTAGDPIVAFGVPTTALSVGIATVFNIPLNPSKNAPKDCLVVAFVVVKASLKFKTLAQAKAFGSIGVAGAKISLVKTGKGGGPFRGRPLYFGAAGNPDTSRTVTESGVGLFSGVPAGTYKVIATKAGSKFASATAVCKPERFVATIEAQL